jgi:hypothetical protein
MGVKWPGRHSAKGVGDGFEQQSEVIAQRLGLGEDVAMVRVLSHHQSPQAVFFLSGFGRGALLPRSVEVDLVEHAQGLAGAVDQLADAVIEGGAAGLIVAVEDLIVHHNLHHLAPAAGGERVPPALNVM